MIKTPSEPVFKKIVRDIVREEIKPELAVFKVDILSAVEKLAERMLGEVAKMRNEIITSNDHIAGEIKTMREENAISSDKVRVINELEDKVENLVKIHPQNSHNFASP